MRKTMQKIAPFLWFDNQAEDAVKFYVSIFGNSKIGSITRYEEEAAKASGRPKGSVMTVAFELAGQECVALNGGPLFKFTEAISLAVNCETQEEVDHFWETLSAGGQEVQCGWLKDRFGVVASRSDRFARDAAGQGPRKIETRHGGAAEDEENQHRRTQERLRQRRSSGHPARAETLEVCRARGPPGPVTLRGLDFALGRGVVGVGDAGKRRRDAGEEHKREDHRSLH